MTTSNFWPEGGAPHVEVEVVENWKAGDWGQALGQNFRDMGDVQRIAGRVLLLGER